MFKKVALVVIPLFCVFFVAADSTDSKSKRNKDKEALAGLQAYIGSWKGVGQVRRGSTRGSWIEESDWIWKFSDTGASLTFKAPKGKYLAEGSLETNGKPGQYQLLAKSPDGKHELKYAGSVDDSGKLVMTIDKPVDGVPARVSIRMVAGGKRLVVLYERLSGTRYARLAEVGYTRKGSGFGKGATFVECVVTGGQGTIPVSHKGKTYYVCCGGCRDLFNDDPETVLAEYREKKEKEKAKENG